MPRRRPKKTTYGSPPSPDDRDCVRGSHAIVALGEGPHGNDQGLAFRLALIRDPRFSAIVNDIVVESGSARYQDAMDRFLRGELPDSVRHPSAGRRPRRAAAVPAGGSHSGLGWHGRSRHTLHDPTRAILSQRDSHPAEVIRREVIAKGRRALVIYGDGSRPQS